MLKNHITSREKHDESYELNRIYIYMKLVLLIISGHLLLDFEP